MTQPHAGETPHSERASSCPAATLSVVIAAWNGGNHLERCLAALASQTGEPPDEVVVVTNKPCPPGVDELHVGLRVRVIELGDAATVPEMRTRGAHEAAGDIVAMLEDHGVCAETWCDAVRNAHSVGLEVVGGAVEKESGEPREWAIYFCDYGKFMLPAVAGPARALTGFNVSYRRSVLAALGDTIRGGFYEDRVHAEIMGRGGALYFDPRIVVFHTGKYGGLAAARHAHHSGRLFAANRVAAAPWYVRMGYAAGTAALPAILALRIARIVLGRRRHVGRWLRSLPQLALLLTAWSAGELLGYSLGEGHSAARWL